MIRPQERELNRMKEEENKRLECIICFEVKEQRFITDKCGHGYYCEKCIGSLLKNGPNQCALCREFFFKKIGPVYK